MINREEKKEEKKPRLVLVSGSEISEIYLHEVINLISQIGVVGGVVDSSHSRYRWQTRLVWLLSADYGYPVCCLGVRRRSV